MSKTIITVQHTESEHHLNGHAGAWGNWPLTKKGHQQAFEIGKWLLTEGCDDGYIMYCSDLTRAAQTADEMNKTLHITPKFSELIREVNAGEGNGKPWDWYDEHKIPPAGYDPDYRPFEDAESDRDLWNRIEPFCKQIVESPDEKILVVSHVCTLSFLQAMLMKFRFEYEAFIKIYNLRFPEDWDMDEDYRFDISPVAFSDNNCLIFAVSNGSMVRVLATSNLEYIKAESRYDL